MSVEAPELTADQLREQTTAWLHDNLPAGWMEAIDDGDNDRWSALRRGLDYGEWCKKMGEAGYATPTWPAEYGAGLSLSPGQAKHVNDVLSHYKVPRSFNIIGIGMGGPTILAWGTEAQKQRLLRPCATNEEIWCQLFSEPGAGSDVAGLSTRAVRDGDEWVVNGQKVWTTLAHIARWGMLVARTDPDQPKHRGLTYFILDMHAPGVEVRPLVQITGEAEFNEVFFDGRPHPRLDARRRRRRRLARRDHHAHERARRALRRRVRRWRRGRRQPDRPAHRPAPAGRRPADAPAAGAGLDRRPVDPVEQPARRRTSASAAPRSDPKARSPS